jgi:hypothetical protein
MIPTERIASLLLSRVRGSLATFCGRMHPNATRASKSMQFEGAGLPIFMKKKAGLSAAIATSIVVFVLGTSSALAKSVHVFSKDFNGGVGHEFSNPTAVAVNDSSGDVYVVDDGNNRVEYFTSAGVYQGEFNGRHVSAEGAGTLTEKSTRIESVLENTPGTFLVGEEIEGEGIPSGTTISGLPEAGVIEISQEVEEHKSGMNVKLKAHQSLQGPEQIAIDNDPSSPSYGDVYVTGHVTVTGEGDGLVWKFSSTGAYLGQLTGTCEKEGEVPPSCTGNPAGFTHFRVLDGVAVDTEGKVWVYQNSKQIDGFSHGEPNIFESNRESAARQATPGFAVNSEDDFYVGHQESFFEIEKLNRAGTKLEALGGQYNSGVAVDLSDNDVYINHTIEEGGGAKEILEFSATGAPVESFGSGDLGGGEGERAAGIGVNSSTGNELSGTVYSADPGAGDVAIFANEPLPVVVERESVSAVESTSARLDATIDPGGEEAPFHFEYGTKPYVEGEGPHGTSIPIPDGHTSAVETGVPVSVLATGLQPETTYHYRVVAVNAKGQDVDGKDQMFTTTAAPSSVPQACANEQLRAEQPYGLTLPDCRAYEMVSPLNKNDSNIFPFDARASLSGEALVYASRGAFTEPASSLLSNAYVARREPDGWSTRNITPPATPIGNINDNPFKELQFTPELSQGLTRSEMVPLTPLANKTPAGYSNIYVADTAAGASAGSESSYRLVTTVTPPLSEQQPYANEAESEEGPYAAGASTDLSHVVFQNIRNLTGTALPDRGHVYESAGSVLKQVDVAPKTGPALEARDTVGLSGDGSDPEKGDVLHAVSENGSRIFFTGGEIEGLEGETPGNPLDTQNPFGQLYVRENPLSPSEECAVAGDACTIEVSASQRTNGHGAPEPDPYDLTGLLRPARYWDASANGERVFFSSRAELTNDANTGPADNAANLYEYNLGTKELTDLTVPTTKTEEEKDPEGAALLGLVTAGEGGSYVYFVANGVLSSNKVKNSSNGPEEEAQPGNCLNPQHSLELPVGTYTCNLYVAHFEGGKWETKFIATLAGSNYDDYNSPDRTRFDEGDWWGLQPQVWFENVAEVAVDVGPANHTVRVTPDGTHLAFESTRSLTGYDNEPLTPGAGSTRKYCTAESQLPVGADSNPDAPCREVYLYDAVTAKLVCASCDPSGARPAGPAVLGGHVPEGSEGSFSETSPFYLQRNLSENGDRLFFDSPDRLVSQDSNGVQDVYEWEAEGEGSCKQAGGCTLPISDVAGDRESYFLDASPNGENVFIATGEQLVPSDTDTRVDVYDAKVGGGFPVTTAPPVCDNADSCKAPESPQPGVFAAPASATFAGPGNPPLPLPAKTAAKKTEKCKRGFVEKKIKKKEQCVKIKTKKKKTKAKKAGHNGRVR